MNLLPEKPLLWIGWDLGIRRDTTGLIAVYREPKFNCYCYWGHVCLRPPVRVRDATNIIRHWLRTERVGGVFFDRWQLMGEAQRLAEEGYGDMLIEVDQSTQSSAFSNNLKAMLDEGEIIPYENEEVRNHLKWTNIMVGERGWRIVKQRQSRHIDLTVALAMALWGAVQDTSHLTHTAYRERTHVRSIVQVA